MTVDMAVLGYYALIGGIAVLLTWAASGPRRPRT